jgi:DNA invertase Pin-like site-specific DNA recombinase
MSDTKEENSIGRQLSQVTPYCQKQGYAVVASHEDRAIAGDEFEKRPGLQRLLADAARGRFDVVVCDQWSRLSRQDPVSFIATVVAPLRDAGITVDTAAEGPQDWDGFVSMIMLTVKTCGTSDEVQKLSYRTLTGNARLAALGRPQGSRPPYGYAMEWEWRDVPGKGPRRYPVRLVPNEYAHVVTWIFERYATDGWSLEKLAAELNARGLECPPPQAKGGKRRAGGGPRANLWRTGAVRCILKNPRYTGASVWNRRTKSKYHTLAGGKARPREPKAKGLERANARADWVIVAGTHKELVSQELFDRAADRMAARKGGKRDDSGYLFSGLVTCAHCGRRLSGFLDNGKRSYRCRRQDVDGRPVCVAARVSEEYLLERFDESLKRLLTPERLTALREEVRRQDEAERNPASVEAVRKQLRDLEANIERGNANLLLLPPDLLEGAAAKLRQWKDERDGVASQLETLAGPGHAASLEDGIRAAETLLWRWREVVRAEDVILLRELVTEVVQRIEVSWTRTPMGRGQTRHRVDPHHSAIHVYKRLLTSAHPGNAAC